MPSPHPLEIAELVSLVVAYLPPSRLPDQPDQLDQAARIHSSHPETLPCCQRGHGRIPVARERCYQVPEA